ncbi:hypothetical protein [Sandarakinorhabdus sp.]|uniref:hypothetical protein n=1 Tax=Sandarakinorhabdus sp. TaxID=1916663 RepID=UPI00286E73AF|nr:hypothetical protein [Sandarakinorhabdus sp.]
MQKSYASDGRFETYLDATGKVRGRLIDSKGRVVLVKTGRVIGIRPTKAERLAASAALTQLHLRSVGEKGD